MDKRNVTLCLFLGIFCLQGQVIAAEDEDALFGETESVVALDQVEDSSISSNLDRASTSISGTINNRTTYSFSKRFVDGTTNWDANSFLTYMEGNLYLDIRLTKGIKSFVNLSVQYSPQEQYKTLFYEDLTGATNRTFREKISTAITIKEFFLDANLARSAYFRVGKQVLQWGRGFLWQPTDLINIDKKNYYDMSFNREGSFGIKTHVPFGTTANLYAYIDFTGIDSIKDTAGAIKAEFLLGATEFAFSAWAKRDYKAVYGFDFSTRVWEFDLWGEVAMSYGDNQPRLKKTNITFPFAAEMLVPTEIEKKWSPKASLGISTTFDAEIKDRIMVTAEFFYDNNGYDSSKFPLEAFAYEGVYVAGYFGKWYGMISSSFSSFFTQALTLTFSAMGNLSDGSFVLSPGLTWTPVYNFTAGLSVNGYCGENGTEFNLAGTDLSVVLTLGLTF